MINAEFFEHVTKRLLHVLPDNLSGLTSDVEKNIKSILESSFAKMNLVTREEFDTQSAVLERARNVQMELLQRIAALEKQVLDTTSAQTGASTSGKGSQETP